MKSELIIINHSFEYSDKIVVQYLFVSPRFRYIIGSKLYLSVEKTLKNLYIGDELKELEFISCVENKYKNGIVKIIFYKKKQKTKYIDKIEKLIFEFNKGQTIGCISCKYYNQKNGICSIWETKIFDMKKNRCDYWEEK